MQNIQHPNDIGLFVEIPKDLEERLHKEYLRRGGRSGAKRLVVIEALKIGLTKMENENNEPCQLAS